MTRERKLLDYFCRLEIMSRNNRGIKREARGANSPAMRGQSSRVTERSRKVQVVEGPWSLGADCISDSCTPLSF